MGVHWTGIVFGLGFVISFGYWTTDFLVVQRVLSANNLRAAKMAPVIGSAFKMAVPFIVILPGLLALAVLKNPDGSLMHLVPESIAASTGQHSYNEVLPLMLIRYCGPGLLGLGITALVAGFMSGMAGNVSAFSTVWTYDIYGAFINKKASDKHYVAMGRWSTVVGMLVSIGTAYLVMNAAGIMDYVQALFSFFIAPLFGTVMLGMLWKRATHWGGFLGTARRDDCLQSGCLSGCIEEPEALCVIIAMSSDMRNRWRRICTARLWSWIICVVVTIVVSLVTKPVPTEQLSGLVYGVTPIPDDGSKTIWQKPIFWAIVVIVVFFILNLIFW